MNLLIGFLIFWTSSIVPNLGSKFCRFEDGFYTCKISIKNSKKTEKEILKSGILEIQGCYLMQVSVNQKNIFKHQANRPVSFDDTGIVEIKNGEGVLVVEVGYEL